MTGYKGYLYTNGVIAAISKRLISKENFTKIIDAQNASNSLMILNNTSFVTGKKVNSVYDVNRLIVNEEISLNNFLKKECPNQIFIDYVSAQKDFYNLETIYKYKIFAVSYEANSFIEGSYPIAKIVECVSSENFDSLNNPLIKEMFEKINQVKDKRGNWQTIDLTFKKYYYKNLFNIVKNDKILKQILQNKIDLQNLITAIRIKTVEELENSYIENGKRDKNFFKQIMIGESAVSASSSLDYIDECLKNLKKCKSEDKLKLLNQQNELVEIKVLSKFAENIESIIPFLKYYYKKILELKNLRMIFSLKQNNLNSHIKERYLEAN